MSITPEEKKYLVEQIENLTSPRPLFYLKFCSCENFAEDVCNGNLYGNTTEYFRQREIDTGERGQGDRFELLLSIQTENITAMDNETGNIVFTAPKGVFKVQFKGDDLIPIVSFVGIPLGDMQIIDADETHADFKFPFTDDEYTAMTERFGKFCVILAAREVETKIATYCNSLGCDYIFDKVEYCDQNRIDRMQAFNKSAKERFLYKNSDLKYQREYRLAVGIEMPKDHLIGIGKLNTAKILESNALRNLMFSINYTSRPKEDN